MTPAPGPSWNRDQLDVDGELVFVVGRRSSPGHFKAFKIEVDTTVGNELRQRARSALDLIDTLSHRGFEPDLHIDPGAECLFVPIASLNRTPPTLPETTTSAVGDGDVRTIVTPHRRGRQPRMDADPEVVHVLQGAASLPPLPAPDLQKFDYTFYAVVLGSGTSRTSFIRKANPSKVVKPGRLLLAYGARLRRVDDPLILIDDRFDMVIGPAGLVALDQGAFEMLMRDLTVLESRYDEYAAEVGEALPIDAGQLADLVVLCRRDSRLGKKLRAVVERGILSTVTIDQVQDQIDNLGLGPGLVSDGHLVLTRESAPTILKLLNEDLFRGGLTSTAYEASHKTTRAGT